QQCRAFLANPDERTRSKANGSSCAVGGVPNNHICGLGRADIVGTIVPHAAFPKIWASSSNKQSAEEPRTPEFERAFNLIVCLSSPSPNVRNSRLIASIRPVTRASTDGLA